MLLEGHRLCCDALEAALSDHQRGRRYGVSSGGPCDNNTDGGDAGGDTTSSGATGGDGATRGAGASGVALPDCVLVDAGRAFGAPEGRRLQRLLEQLPHATVVTTTSEVHNAPCFQERERESVQLGLKAGNFSMNGIVAL